MAYSLFIFEAITKKLSYVSNCVMFFFLFLFFLKFSKLFAMKLSFFSCEKVLLCLYLFDSFKTSL